MDRARAFGTTRWLSGVQPVPLGGVLTAAIAPHAQEGQPQHPRLRKHIYIWTVKLNAMSVLPAFRR